MGIGSRPPSPRRLEPDLVAGRVGRPHGLDGSFHVTGPRPRLLDEGARVRLEPGGPWHAVVRRAGTDARPIVRLEGIADREAADALRGRDLLVERGAAPALEPGEFWAEDFAGCRVVDGEREVGEVLRLLAYPSCELLEVRRPEGPSLLVPLIDDAVRELDVPGRRIDVDLVFLGEA